MLVKKEPEINDIVILKLITTEEIVGKLVQRKANSIVVKKPFALSLVQVPNMNQPVVAPTPWVLGFSDDAELEIKFEHIISWDKGRTEIINSYIRATTSIELVGPNSNIIPPRV